MQKINSSEGFGKVSTIAAIAIAVMTIAILSSYATVKLMQSKNPAPATPTLAATASPTQSVTTTPTPNETANWKTYTNEELALEFKYPKEWGDAKFTRNKCQLPEQAPKGELFRIIFTLNKKIAIGGNSADCAEPRGAGWTDFGYYSQISSNVYEYHIGGDKTGFEFTPNEILEPLKILVLENQKLGLVLSPAQIGALVNMNHSVFKGMSFIYFNPSENEKEIFKSMLSTFKFTDTNQAANGITYTNNKYGFKAILLDSWKGYSILTESWQGTTLDGKSTQYQGPEIIIRNPKWTAAQPWQDIPIMVFTKEEWKLIEADDLGVSAAPYGPTKLDENQKYVFALPPRWVGFTDVFGQDEAQEIVKTIKATPLTK